MEVDFPDRTSRLRVVPDLKRASKPRLPRDQNWGAIPLSGVGLKSNTQAGTLPTKLLIVGQEKQGMSFALRVSTKQIGKFIQG